MNKKMWEQWGIPTVIGLLLLIAGLYLNSWATGVPLRPPFTGEWIKSLMTFPVHMPVWMLLLVVAVPVFAWFLLRRGPDRKSTGGRSGDAERTVAYRSEYPTTQPETSASVAETTQPRTLETSLSEFVIPTGDDYVVRIQRYTSQNTRGLSLTIDNNRLGGIHPIRLIISKAQSYD